jgi:DNA sulfur modification protein DndB
MDAVFEYVFPAIRGVQAQREYYVSMCPLRLLPKIFLFDEDELVPEVRAQRTLNRARIPEIARYILDNPHDYTFSAITASIDAVVRFEPVGEGQGERRMGLLHVPMSARFVINDGQHRRAAIEQAIRENPDIADEAIAVVFFLDTGLERCQQMFADLNRHAIRPSTSIGLLYDHRDDMAQLARLVVLRSPVFRDMVEMERSTLSPRSRRLFTLSAIYSATSALLSRIEEGELNTLVQIAVDYWEEVAEHMPEWMAVRSRKMTAGDVRRDFLHSHGIVLQALGKVGSELIQQEEQVWKATLTGLRSIDWTRSNAQQWEGRALVGGRVSKAGHHVTLTTNLLKNHLSLSLTPEEQRVEDAFARGDYDK